MDHMKNIYELLYKDILLNVRTTMAAGFKEVINLVEIEKMENPEDQQYFITIINHYLKDTEEIVSQKVLPTMCTLVSKFPEEKKLELLDSLIKQKIETIKQMKNGRDTMISMLEQLFEMFPSPLLVEAEFHQYLFDIIDNERAIKYKIRAGQVLGQKIIAPLIKGKKHRQMLTEFTDKLRTSRMFRDR